jgi:hypothetical protein
VVRYRQEERSLPMRFRLLKRTVCAVAIASQLSGCGYIIYPERVGQKGGLIDPAVAILDGAGLLFFIIPGLISFAVDFSYGTIYLPPGQRGPYPPHDARLDGWQKIAVAPAQLDEAGIEAVLRAQLHREVSLHDPALRVYRLDSAGELADVTGQVSTRSG